MRTFILGFLIFCAWALFSRWYYVCNIKGLCPDSEVLPQPPKSDDKTRAKTLSLKHGDKVILEGYEEFAFDPSGIQPLLSANNNEFLDKVAAYLKQNPDINLKINGVFKEGENADKAGMLENLGLARANVIRGLLTKLGIPENKIGLDFTKAAKLDNPLKFGAFDLEKTVDGKPPDGGPAPPSFTFTNMTFTDTQFEFNSSVFNPTRPFLVYSDSVKTYLSLNPGKTVYLIGHTDHIGSSDYNYSLGIDRGNSVKNYLIKTTGIAGKRITVSSKGEKKPIATNETEEGRAKNRRVNIQLQ